ncbi:unnamed protein product [Adineta steineri]|uniref:ADP ribosyltransferase domain-containing protein n=1 Tax=Adineta steineri TaxID=433720 RepID=A0A815KFU8_9BILA|nr:unnamed protein product [Adineta steineri]CAF1395154.1 unnamed protein product [Adineta steineri]
MVNNKSLISVQINTQVDAKHVSTFSKDAIANRRINMQRMQNVLLIWLDSNINDNDADCDNTIQQLTRIVNNINTFTDPEECFEFIQTITNNKICMIVSGSLGQHIVSRVHDMSQVDSIFIFCDNQEWHKQWAKEWSKIKGVYTDITSICEGLKQAAHQYLFGGILLNVFLYSMLNQALRLMDVDIILRMGFFINDLHRDIQRLHSEQFDGEQSGETFTVYRGQFLSKEDFTEMNKTKGGLLSFNNFLSTSKDRDVSLFFTPQDATDPAFVIILFVISINLTDSTTPFASIADVSRHNDEDEVLFSMHTVFRIKDIQPIDGYNHVYEAQEVYEDLLDQTTDENDKVPIYHQLGIIKDRQGEHQEALTYLEKSLAIKQKTLSSNHPDLANSYNSIGLVYDSMGDYPKALSYHKKNLEILQRSLSSNHPDLGTSYNNIGNMYYNMGDYEKALSYYEEDCAILQQSLPSNHPSFSDSYLNIGMVHENMGNYSKAHSFYERSVQIGQQSLPSKHPTLEERRKNLERMKKKLQILSVIFFWKTI